MVIALLVILGFDIIALVVLPVFELRRKRWSTRQPGVFAPSHDLDRVSGPFRSAEVGQV